eukprot:gene8375-200_t
MSQDKDEEKTKYFVANYDENNPIIQLKDKAECLEFIKFTTQQDEQEILKVTLTLKALEEYKSTTSLQQLNLASFFIFDELVMSEEEMFVKKFTTLDPADEESIQLKECIISDSQKLALENDEKLKSIIPVPELSEVEAEAEEEKLSQKDEILEYFELKTNTQSSNTSSDLGLTSQRAEVLIENIDKEIEFHISPGQPVVSSLDKMEIIYGPEEEEEFSEEDLISDHEKIGKEEVKKKNEATQTIGDDIETEIEDDEKIEYVNNGNDKMNNSDFSMLHGATDDDDNESFKEGFIFQPVGLTGDSSAEILSSDISDEDFGTPKKRKKQPYENLLKHSYTPRKTSKNRHSMIFKNFVEKIQGNTRKNEEIVLEEQKKYIEYSTHKIISPAQTPTSSILIRKNERLIHSDEPRKRKIRNEMEEEEHNSEKKC